MTAVYETVKDVIEADIKDRGERMADVEKFLAGRERKLTDYEHTILTDYILREELSDPNPHKVAHTEYPFFSEYQFERREDRELSDKAVAYRGSDGRDYSPPVPYRNPFRDNVAKAKNGNRRRAHNAFKAGESSYTHMDADGAKEVREYPFIIKARPIHG